jgi:hypothetical protein
VKTCTADAKGVVMKGQGLYVSNSCRALIGLKGLLLWDCSLFRLNPNDSSGVVVMADLVHLLNGVLAIAACLNFEQARCWP